MQEVDKFQNHFHIFSDKILLKVNLWIQKIEKSQILEFEKNVESLIKSFQILEHKFCQLNSRELSYAS